MSSKHQVVGVITQPDRPAGRGMKLEPPPVKTHALKAGLPILQPEKVNSDTTYKFLNSLRPDVLAVVAYGEFLGAELLNCCPFKAVNVHPSLLPDLRGAAPVQWALIRGYRKTGVTTQVMSEKMDAGDILLQKEFEVGETECAKSMLERLSPECGKLLVLTLDGLAAGSITPRKQNPSQATFAPILKKEDGLVKFNECNAWTAHNRIRGLHPWPGAYSFINKKRVKILRSTMARGQQPQSGPGSFWMDSGHMYVVCQEGVLEILELQPEGKRAMLPKEFENGIRASETPQRFENEGE
ncbi:MAG TPA: methionyl-tRNA formyltransferase [Bdellovibrionota bacterium]